MHGAVSVCAADISDAAHGQLSWAFEAGDSGSWFPKGVHVADVAAIVPMCEGHKTHSDAQLVMIS